MHVYSLGSRLLISSKVLAEIVNFMQENNITDAKILEAFYLGKIFDIVESYR